MLYTTTKVVAAHGTPEAVSATRIIASWGTVQAFVGNSGPVYVGGVLDGTTPVTCNVRNDVDNGNDGKSYRGHRLTPGDFANIREMGGVTYLDLRYLFVDADNSNDGIVVNYGRR